MSKNKKTKNHNKEDTYRAIRAPATPKQSRDP